MRVLKFGGSSVKDPERIRSVVAIVRAALREGPAVVVVSALGGVTDQLVAACAAAARGDETNLALVVARHAEAAAALALPAERGALLARVEAVAGEVADLVRGIALVRECSPRTRDAVLSAGERLSAELVAAAVRAAGVAAEACDSRALIVTDAAFGSAQVKLDESFRRLAAHVGGRQATQIVTGFIAATERGETTTLGRGGSDYTAALVGVAIGAEVVEIWTDVNGVMSADPRLVPHAYSLPTLSFAELMELSHFGAKVVYPPTVHPARRHGIPLVIKNTLAPDHPGTRILERAAGSSHAVRGISSINDVALLRLEGAGMIGVPGIAGRLFGALARAGISVILISQASSEHSICLAIKPDDVERACEQVDGEFELERGAGLVDPLVVERELAVVAVVGEAMSEALGLAGRVFSVLGRHGVNVRAIAQGSSELNISFVVARRDEARAVVAIHDEFFPERAPAAVSATGGGRIPVAVLGATGSVGQRMVALLADHPWFELAEVVASDRSAGRSYGEAARWLLATPLPDAAAALTVRGLDDQLISPLVLSALDAAVAGPVEERLAAAGHLVVSNARNHRMRPDVPLLVPEVNPDHLELLRRQPYGRGAIVTNPNCSTIGLVLALKPLVDAFGLEAVQVVTLQALSGAGYPGVASLDAVDNVVPFIDGEEEKIESETRKILGALGAAGVVDLALAISAACNRVAVVDGHTECVAVRLTRPATAEDIRAAWAGFTAAPQRLGLPSAPRRPLQYVAGDSGPQPRLHRDAGGGMTVSLGRLRPCPVLGWKFVLLAHNTIRGAAGGSLLAAELAVARGAAGLAAPVAS